MALTINEVLGNGHVPSLSELRGLAARLGLPSDGGRVEIISAIGKYEKEVQQLRIECAKFGLPTDGEVDDLKVRLAASESDSLAKKDKIAYQYSTIIAVVMGVAGLAISLPHISLEISYLMGCNLFFGIMFAITIDGGFIVMKVIDSLREKFHFNNKQLFTIRFIMFSCLVMSAFLNSNNFSRNVTEHGGGMIDQTLAILFATFISVFVFCMFVVSASMYTKCVTKKEVSVSEEIDPASKLITKAKQFKEICELAEKC